MANDLVIGVFDRARLSEGLVAIHRAGFGPQARVLDASRGALTEQLRKLGQYLVLDLGPDETDTVLVVIGAPGRQERAIATLRAAGARATVGRETVPGLAEPGEAPEPEPASLRRVDDAPAIEI